MQHATKKQKRKRDSYNKRVNKQQNPIIKRGGQKHQNGKKSTQEKEVEVGWGHGSR